MAKLAVLPAVNTRPFNDALVSPPSPQAKEKRKAAMHTEQQQEQNHLFLVCQYTICPFPSFFFPLLLLRMRDND